MKKVLVIAAIAALAFGSAQAEDAPSDGPTISGGVQLNEAATDDIAAGIGNESKASQEIGNINSGKITGDVEVGGEATNDISAGIGNKSCASQKIGSIGGKGSDCD